jgi:uncharacterized RDD family membrane protein YckC
MNKIDSSSRAGFWRRLFAFLIDFTLVTGIVGLIGLWLGSATNGGIRISNTVIDSSVCVGGTIPAELRIPSAFKPTNVTQCTKSFFGIAHDWVLDVAERTLVRPNTTYTRGIALPLDPAGQLANPIYLDVLIPFLLAAYLILAERKHGNSIGKRALRLSVRSIDRNHLSGSQAAKRTILFMLPIIFYQSALLYFMMIDSSQWLVQSIEHASAITARWIISVILLSAFAINFMVTSWRRSLPWHDEWAGTEVVDLRSDLNQPSKDISETFA